MNPTTRYAGDTEQDGFRCFFYSNDHEPIHVHVRHSEGLAKGDFGQFSKA